MKVLVERGADLDVKDEEGQGLLHVAACFGDFKALNLLLKADLRIQTAEDQDILGHVPLQNFDLDRPKYVQEEPEMWEQCRQVLLQLIEQQRKKRIKVQELL